MKPLEELINKDDPGIALIREWVRTAENGCEILPPSANREMALMKTRVTTRSTMGAIVYETGGILVDHSWLRFIGSGHAKLTRVLPDWNEGRSRGLWLVADDAAGGFFAINGGALGEDLKMMYYWSPDNLDWEPLGIGFTDFFRWSLTSRLAAFYESLRWPSWEQDVSGLSGDSCYSFYPFLWTKEGSITESHKATVPVGEAYDLKMELARQLRESKDDITDS